MEKTKQEQLYEIPSFIKKNKWANDHYRIWLQHKAVELVKRDRKRFEKQKESITVSNYKKKINTAVYNSKGFDEYTKETLNWELISTYNNKEAKKLMSTERKQTYPSVDHLDPRNPESDFKICSWTTNDCKNDLTIEELVKFCQKIININRNSSLTQ